MASRPPAKLNAHVPAYVHVSDTKLHVRRAFISLQTCRSWVKSSIHAFKNTATVL